jgi:hypothetical protein
MHPSAAMLLVCLALFGCVSAADQQNRKMDAALTPFVGKSVADFALAHGPPTNTIDMGEPLFLLVARSLPFHQGSKPAGCRWWQIQPNRLPLYQTGSSKVRNGTGLVDDANDNGDFSPHDNQNLMFLTEFLGICEGRRMTRRAGARSWPAKQWQNEKCCGSTGQTCRGCCGGKTRPELLGAANLPMRRECFL